MLFLFLIWIIPICIYFGIAYSLWRNDRPKESTLNEYLTYLEMDIRDLFVFIPIIGIIVVSLILTALADLSAEDKD